MRQTGQAYDDQGYDDGFAIPRPSGNFRVPRHRPGMDRTTRSMIVVAAGIALLIVAAVAVQAMLRPHGLPVVAAQSGPWREKPLNPGGMQVEGTGNAIFNGTRPVTQDQVMPGPETPDLAALAHDAHPTATPATAANPAQPGTPASPAPAAPPQAQAQAQGPSKPLTPRGVEAVAAMPLPPQLAPAPLTAPAPQTTAAVQAPASAQVATTAQPAGAPQPATAVQASALPQATSVPQAAATAPYSPVTPAATVPAAALPVPPMPVAPPRIAAAVPSQPASGVMPPPATAAATQPASTHASSTQTALAQAAAGTAVVQLAALPTEAGALAEWQILSRRMPALLGGRSPMVTKALVNGHTWWRLRTGGFASLGAARDFCSRIKAQGGACAAEGS